MKATLAVLRVLIVTACGTLGVGLGMYAAGPIGPAWLANSLFTIGLGAGLGLGLLASETVEGEARLTRIWRLGYPMAASLFVIPIALILLALGSGPLEGPARSALLSRPPQNPGLMSVACDMAATILVCSVIGGAVGASVVGAPKLSGRRGTLLCGGALGGGFGGLILEMILFFSKTWHRPFGGLTPPADSALLGVAWLSAFVGLGVVVADRIGAVLNLRRGVRCAAIHGGKSIIGSSPLCDVTISGEGIRPIHAETQWAGKGMTIRALDGAKLVIAGERAVEAEIADGDEITLGDVTFYARYNFLRAKGESVRRAGRPAAEAADSEPTREAQFVLVEGPLTGDALTLSDGLSVIGSSPEADMVLPGSDVAARHATLIVAGDQMRITDEEGTAGIRVNGERVDTAVLSPGSRVNIGEHMMLIVGGQSTRAPAEGAPEG